MEFTVEMSKIYNLSPFEIMEKDKDSVIMLINYFIEKGNTETIEKPAAKNDGFWDF